MPPSCFFLSVCDVCSWLVVSFSQLCNVWLQHQPALQAPVHIGLVKAWDLGLFYSLAGFLFSKPYFLHPVLSQEQVLVKQAFCLWPVAQRTTTRLVQDKEASVWAWVCVAVAEKHRQTERDREVRRKVKASQLLYQVFSQMQMDPETDPHNLWVITCMRYPTQYPNMKGDE